MLKIIGIIAVVPVIDWIFGFGGDSEEATETAIGASMSCGYVILQIFFTSLGILFTTWLFGLLLDKKALGLN